MTCDLRSRLDRVNERVGRAFTRAGRTGAPIVLVAVSKTRPVEDLKAAIRVGLGTFGENRVQEAGMKMKALGREASWHLVGHLQTNKVNDATGRFDLIHSVDSPRILQAINRRAQNLDCRQAVMLQVNLSGEKTKHGLAEDDLPGILDDCAVLDHVRCMGLMTLPPFDPDPECSRPWFRKLRQLLKKNTGHQGLEQDFLSMGMSNDYEVAVEEGATHLRLGTAIFGKRDS